MNEKKAECYNGEPCDESKCEAASICIGEQQSEEDRKADRQAILDAAHRGKVMRLRDLPTQYDELRSWISAKYGTAHILAVLNDEYARLKWYTRDSVIGVVVHLPTEKRPQGYIGATASSRAPNPGETWTRVNDLADGPYCKETWDRVVADAAFWDVLPLEVDLGGKKAAPDATTYPVVGMKTRSEALKPWGLDADGDELMPIKTIGVDPAKGGADQTVSQAVEGEEGVPPADGTLDAITRALQGDTDCGLSVALDKLVAESYEKWATAAYDRGEQMPAGMDSRIITDNPEYDKHTNSVYPSTVTVGATEYSISRVMTPVCTSHAVQEANNVRSNIIEMVRSYVDELARRKALNMSDGATRPLIYMNVVAGTVKCYNGSDCDADKCGAARYYVYGFNFVKVIREVVSLEA